MALTERNTAFNSIQSQAFCIKPPKTSGKKATDRVGRDVTEHLGQSTLPQYLPELQNVRLLDRNISFVNKVQLFVDMFLSWVKRSPTQQQKHYLAALHKRITNDDLNEDKINTLFSKGVIQARINSDDANALELMVDNGLAKRKPSDLNVIKVEFIRPSSNDSLKQAATELLNEQRLLKRIRLRDSDTLNIITTKNALETAAIGVITSLTSTPICLEKVFNKIHTFNSSLMMHYNVNRTRSTLEPKDVTDEFDRIFDHRYDINILIKPGYLDSFLCRAAEQISNTELIDDASQDARRVKDSAPLLIQWLAKRLQLKPTNAKCSDEEAKKIKQALDSMSSGVSAASERKQPSKQQLERQLPPAKHKHPDEEATQASQPVSECGATTGKRKQQSLNLPINKCQEVCDDISTRIQELKSKLKWMYLRNS